MSRKRSVAEKKPKAEGQLGWDCVEPGGSQKGAELSGNQFDSLLTIGTGCGIVRSWGSWCGGKGQLMEESATSDNLHPHGALVFYEGDDPEIFAIEMRKEFGVDVSGDDWTRCRAFVIPPGMVEAIYGSRRWELGSQAIDVPFRHGR